MKTILSTILDVRKKWEWNEIHLVYVLFCVMFIGICLYEIVLFLISQYSFFNAILVFTGVTLLYIVYLHKSFPLRARQKAYASIKNHHYTKVLTRHSQSIVYCSFIFVSLVFLTAFYFLDQWLLRYTIYAFFVIFAIFTISGGRIDTDFWNTQFSQKTLLKIGVMSLSVFLVFLSSFITFYNAELHRDMILLVWALVYIVGFIVCFTDTLYRTMTYFQSGCFHQYAKRNTYNILSTACIGIAVILLLWKFGFIYGGENTSDNNQILAIEKTQPLESAPVITLEPEQEYRTEIKLASEVFDFGETSLFLGSVGSEVAQLQEALTLLGSYIGPASGEFDEVTRDSLISTLQSECDWPESTRWILWPQARSCIYSLSVETPVDSITQ